MPEEAIKFAKKLLESDEDYLDNVIKLWHIGNEKYGQCWNTEFHIFGEIESETDHLPLTHVRSKCSEEFLIKADKELKETIEYYRTVLLKLVTSLSVVKTYNKRISERTSKAWLTFVPR